MKLFDGVLLAVDMDGTLLDRSKQISPRNRQALQYFVEQGGRFSLATGRAPDAVRDYLPLLPINTPYSLLNGSLILDEQHRVHDCAGMPEESKSLIADVLLKYSQLGCEIFAGDQILVRQHSAVTKQHMASLRLRYRTVTQAQLGDTSSWCKINLTGDTALIEQVKAYLMPYRDRFSMASSIETFLEITAHGVDKGAALQTIAARCAIDPANVYAIGDSENDASMLQAAHVGFAPNDATPPIRALAQVIVSDHEHDAVADVIAWLHRRYQR